MHRTALLLGVGIALAFGMDWFLGQFIEDYVVRIINLCGIAIILAVSLNVINGLCGQFSLGHAGFMAIGAYVSAYFTTTLRVLDTETGQTIVRSPLFDGSWGFAPALVIGGIAAAVAGLIVGVPTLRLKGDYLAIATLGFGEIVTIMITNFDSVGASRGLPGLPAYATTFWVMTFVVICVVFSAFLQRSTFGRALIAIRENELAAEVMGIRVARLKVMAFIYGAFFAGIAGGLLGHLLRTISPATFNFMKSIEVVVMLVLGGLGSMTGAIVGAITLTVLPEALRGVEAKPNPDLIGMHLLLYGLLASPVVITALKPLKHRLKPLLRLVLAAGGSLIAAVLVAFVIQTVRDDGMQPALPGTRMVVYALALILLMIFRPQGIFGQRELSLKLLRRLMPGGKQ